MGRMIIGLLLFAVNLQAYTPCKVEDPCLQEDPGRLQRYGSTVGYKLLNGDLMGWQAYPATRQLMLVQKRILIREVLSRDSVGIITAGIRLRVSSDALRVAVSVYERPTATWKSIGFLDKNNPTQNAAVLHALARDSRITPIRMVPSVLPAGGVGWWSDLTDAFYGGGYNASSACTQAMLFTMAMAAAMLGNVLNGEWWQVAASTAAYFAALQNEKDICGCYPCP